MPYGYATHLECSATGERYDIGKLQGLSAARKPLLARYDLTAAARLRARGPPATPAERGRRARRLT